MNVLSRPLFDMPPEMVEGTGITSMGMEEGPPSSMGEQEARDIGGMIAGNLAGRIEQTELGIDGAEDELGMMNALRGEEQSEEEYRDELAELVGPKDAAATPNSVLALIQPTLAMVQMAEQMGTQGGGTGGIGDLGGMGDLGDMSALMGGMGGDSLGGLAAMLPQDQPMPMEMMAVEENIAGVMPDQEMPTQMFALGGAALSAPQIKEMLMSLQPAVPQTPEKGFWESALQIGAPAIAAGLMGEPGKEWRTGLGMLAKSSSAALQQEEKRKLDNERLLYASEAGAGTKAGTAWLAQQTAADLAANTLAKAKAAGSNLTTYQKLLAQYVDPNTPEKQKELLFARMSKLTEPSKGPGSDLTPFQKLLAQRDHPDTTPAQREEIQLYLNKLSHVPQTRAEIEQARQETNVEMARQRNFGDEQNRYGKVNIENATNLAAAVKERVDISQLTGLISGLKDLTRSGAGREATVKLSHLVTAGSRILGLGEREVRGLLSAIPGINLDEDLALADVERALGNQVTLMYTSNFPGNLNQSEVDISANSAYAGLAGTQEGAQILDMLMKKKTSRAQERQKLYFQTRKDHYAAAKGMDDAASERVLFHKWNEADAAFTESYQGDTSIIDYIRENVPSYAPGGVPSNQTPALLLPGVTPEQQNEMFSNVLRSEAFVIKAKPLVKLDSSGQLVSTGDPGLEQESRKRMVNVILNRVIPQILASSEYEQENIKNMSEGYKSLTPENQTIVRNFVLRSDNVRSTQQSIGDGWKNVIEQFFGPRD